MLFSYKKNNWLPILFTLSIIITFQINLTAKEIKIKNIKLDDKKTLWALSKYYYNVNYTKLDKDGLPVDLVVLYRPNSVSFKFSCSDSTKLIFRNRVEGLNNHWTFCDTSRFLTFTNFKTGKYTYHVQGLKQNKIICNKIFQFEIYKDNGQIFIIDFLLLSFSILFIYGIIKIK